jgi:GNAT superfamily N-acetyltransferase
VLGSEDVLSRSEQADLSEIPVGEGQTFRPAEESDAEAIAAVANAMSERLYGEAAVSPDEIRRWFAYTGLETRVVEMNGHVVGYMDVERRAGGRIQMDVCVHPDAWGSAAASTLIGAAEAWARADTREGDFMRAFAFEREDYLRQALEDRGYGFIRHHLFMLIELSSEPPDPGWPEGILVRPFRPGDERAVYEADMEAFSDHWDFQVEPFALWRERTVQRDDFDPSLWLIAWDGEDVAGFSLSSWHSSGDPTYGWVHVLGVR